MAALALTLSMGSFAAMAVGIAVLFLGEYRRERSWRAALCGICGPLARASLGIGSGLLLYVAVAQTDVGALGWLAAGYVFGLAACWDECLSFLEGKRRAVAIAAMGALVALAAVLLRPNAAATFLERVDMMRDGLGYVRENLLFGVGAFRWRKLNMAGSGQYFGTWHIHDALIHAAAELGVPAAVMLAAAWARAVAKQGDVCAKSMLAAFALHAMIDVSFFYAGIPGMLIALTAGRSECPAGMPAKAAKAVFLIAGAFFAYVLFHMPIGA